MREPWDRLEEVLGVLRTHDADPRRVERTRARCLAALAAQRREQQPRRPPLTLWPEWLETALALGLGTFYLAVAFTSSIALLH